MKEANPSTLVDELKAVLGRYISTALPINRRYPRLAERFRKILATQNLVEGPYVEALPDFDKGASLEELLLKNGGFLHDALGQVPTASRRLHKHQERALQLAVRDCKSQLVATGTGSGKTETFLYPIAHALLSDPEPEKPGVRALLVYPMNALANDQLYYRIAPLFGQFLKGHNITFGRYTGQIRANIRRGEEESRLLNNAKLMRALEDPEEIPANWKLTREEMLIDPPKVLITNYAMLEHLLLLPRNERLFATNALKFIVLDEIHTYNGAQATEVAFLLRKLKNRLGIDSALQVFGTSASLADGPQADEQLKTFACSLFGEKVEEVVRGKRIAHYRLQQPITKEFTLTASEWVKLGGVLEEVARLREEERFTDTWNAYLEGQGLTRSELPGPNNMPLGPYLEQCFSANREVRRVAQFLDQAGVKSYRELARLIFDSPTQKTTDAERNQALSAVIHMGMLARVTEESFPLLPGRYHIAVNSIEGLALLPSSDGEGWAQLKAARHYRDADGLYFPLLTCRKCGQPYIEAFQEGLRLHNRRPDANEAKAVRRVFWLGKPAGHVADEEDESPDAFDGNSAEYVRLWLDVKTGGLGAVEGAVPLFAIDTEHDEQEQAWYVRKCPACGGRASGTDAEIVTRMHPGNAALGSVVTQRVLESLPVGLIDYAEPRPAQGRTLLTFSDNRQDAAFFAPYFERTAADLALRSAIRNVLRDRDTPVNAPQLADQVFQHWQRDGRQPILLDANGDIRTDRQDVTGLLLAEIGKEFCTPGGRRNSLEALGVVGVTYDEAKLRQLRSRLLSIWPEGMSNDANSVDALIHILIENIRRERALYRFHGVALKDAFIWGNYDQHRSFDIENGDTDVKFRWLPAQQQTRHNRRTWYLCEQLGLTREVAYSFLRQIWELLVKPPLALMARYNPGFAFDGDTVRFYDGYRRPLYICKSCGLMQQYVLSMKCTAFRCSGDVEEILPAERAILQQRHHYLATYEESNHVTVRAREHTASLSTELREQIERDFAERRLNLISCTTTMEMGVDLGELEAVVNLNVPPGVANYQQRTGRAGRRAQAAPFCVTVARNTNYDQAVIRDFSGYLAASPAAPFIHLDNAELFWRHQNSVLLSHYFRHRITDQNINAPSLKHLFGDGFDKTALRTFTEAMYQWLEGVLGRKAMAEAETLIDHLPSDLRCIGLRGVYLRNRFVGAVREFAEEVFERYSKYTEMMETFKQSNELGRAAYWQRMREDFMGQFLVNQLSRRGLIPTYSFPIHSLSLEVLRDSGRQYNTSPDIALTRDATLGISEYAPGAEVVANGRIWQSAGLAHYPKAFMPERWYVACPECFHVDIGDTSDELPPACSNCASIEGRRRRRFVEPREFVTSYGQRNGRDPGSSRRMVRPADEARLIAAPRDEVFVDTGLPFLRTALLKAREAEGQGLRGTLFIANRGTYGEGYFRCAKCNFAAPIKPPSKSEAGKKKKKVHEDNGPRVVHNDPQTALRCSNEKLSRFGLDFVHRFDTDVRLFRFLAPLPDTGREGETARRVHERLARTICESLRLAASELLQLQPGEVRSIYRLYEAAGGTLEVVLYDGVPGGAGYCSRLGEAGYSFTELLKRARKRLDCPAQCDSGCRVCLFDYGNQRFWDSFDRLPALRWLNSLLDPSTVPSGPGQYVRWPSPSLAGLNERVANYSHIHLVGRSLVESGSYAEDNLNQLIAWLQAGKTVHIHLANKLDEKPNAHGPLTVYRRLHPYIVEKRLHLYQISPDDALDWGALPRIFTSTEMGTPVIRQHFAVQPFMEGLIAAPAETGVVDEEMRFALEHLIALSLPTRPDVLREGEKLAMWELPIGKKRELSSIFEAISGAYIKDLVIRDPYCGARPHRQKLKAFLTAIKALATTVEHVAVQCKEYRDKDGDVEFYLDVERHIDELVQSVGFANRDVTVAPLKGSNRAFHDREVDIVTVAEDGCETMHRYFLTGGIEYLMEDKAATRVFYIRIDR